MNKQRPLGLPTPADKKIVDSALRRLSAGFHHTARMLDLRHSQIAHYSGSLLSFFIFYIYFNNARMVGLSPRLIYLRHEVKLRTQTVDIASTSL